MSALGSSVTEVVVFQRGARVARCGVAEAQAATLAFEGLPLCLDDESIRVELGEEAAARGWTVTDVRVEVDAPHKVDVPEPEDDAALAAASDARERARARLQATRASMQGLREVGLQPRASEHDDRRATHDPTPGRLGWLRMRSEALASLQDTLAEQREALEQADQALRSARKRRRETTSSRDPRALEPRKRVVLRLVAGEELGEVPVELTYRVPGARWAPSYVLRLEGEGRATLQLRAVVAQRTGEDWTGARLTLSSASWQAWHDLPRLDALRVGRVQSAAARSGWREPPPDPESLYADYDRAAAQIVMIEAAMAEPEPVAEAQAAPQPRAAKKRKPVPPPRPAPAAPPGRAMSVAAPAPLADAVTRSAAVPQEESAVFFDEGEVDGFGGGGAPPSSEPESDPEPEPGLGRQWFDYGRLRLPRPGEPGRGRLQRVAMLTDGDAGRLGVAVDEAARSARALEPGALPPGHAWVCAKPGHAHAYPCQSAVEIPGDGQGHVVAVLEAEVETTRSYVCVPRVSAEVFRILCALNPLKVPLPAGPLDVYEGDTFLLSGSVDAVGSGGRFEVGLGVEQAIKVARNVSFSEDAEGLLKRSNTYAHAIVVDVQNLLPVAASLELRDRVPVRSAKHPDIEITEDEAQPPWEHYAPKGDPLEGGRRWRIDVPAGQKTTLRAGYTIRVPGASELVGGNRREA